MVSVRVRGRARIRVRARRMHRVRGIQGEGVFSHTLSTRKRDAPLDRITVPP